MQKKENFECSAFGEIISALYLA